VPEPDTSHDRSRSHRPPSDELVLAAIERAALHRARDTPAVPVWSIIEHLGLSRRSAGARQVRIRLEQMTAAGDLYSRRNRGVVTWELTGAGRRRLSAARLSGQGQPLPESPQNLAWRRAQTAAACEVERFRRELGDRLGAALDLLAADPPAHSDRWLALGEHLHRDTRRLASAMHCLHEWSEPHDDRSDIDDHSEPGDERLETSERARVRARRVGRRNLHLWDNDPGDVD